MGKDVIIRGETYQGIETVTIPVSGGNAVFRDTSGADAVASDILVGKTAYGASGLITGTRQPPSGSINITENGSVDVTDYATALVNVQGGGGGPTASDAILTVTALAGSTVTAAKGSVTLVPTLWTTAADSTLECALFVIEAAQFDSATPWTVTATNGTFTASKEITISENKQYAMIISFEYQLIISGVMMDGDFVLQGMKSTSSSSAAAYAPSVNYTDNVRVGYFSSGSSARQGIAYFPNQVNLSDYSKLVVVGTGIEQHSNLTHLSVNLWSAIGTYQDDNRLLQQALLDARATTQTPFDLEIDISALSGLAFVGFNFMRTADTATYTNCYLTTVLLRA